MIAKTFSNPAQGLILVYAEPGPRVPEKDFHDWYENDHVPLRLEVPGVLTCVRYKAVDSQTPSWLTLYDLASPDVAQSDEYKALPKKATDREKQIMPQLATINRKTYEHLISYTHPNTPRSSLPARFVFIVHMQVTLDGEEEFNKWYNEEHMGLLAKIPGWLCGRRYKLIESVSRGVKLEPTDDVKPYADYLAIHELERDGFLGLPEFKNAIQTPWRERVAQFIINRELRLFEQYRIHKRSAI